LPCINDFIRIAKAMRMKQQIDSLASHQKLSSGIIH